MPVHSKCPPVVQRRSSNGERCSDGQECSEEERRSNGKYGSDGTQRVEWLWPGRLALGQLTILTGGTMSGKSFLTADLAARVTNGFDWPDAMGTKADAGNPDYSSGEIPPSAQPARVLFVPGSPSRARRLWPRLAAAGADLDRVVVDQADRTFVPNDEIVASIEKALSRAGDCKLVIFEPPPIAFGSRGAELDLEYAAFLQSLADLAARRKVAVLAVVGLRHDFSAPVSKRHLGALASCGAAMSVLALLRDEASPELRYLVAARSPDADDRTAMAFRICQDRSCAPGTSARVEWRAETLAAADGASRAFGGAAASRRAVRVDAIHWLKSLLGDGGMPVTEIQREAKGAGYSWATVRRAQQELAVRAHREYTGCHGHWFWEMEADAWLAGQSRVAADMPRDLPQVELINLATMNLATVQQSAQLAEQGAQLAREDGRLAAAGDPAPEQGAQLVGQGAQLAGEINSRLTPAARPDQGAQLEEQDAQLAHESNSRLTPAARPVQGAQLAREITGRLTPAARRDQGAQLPRENGRLDAAGDPPPGQGAQLVGQGAQLARETTGRLTPAARQEQDAQLVGQGAQLAHDITGRLTPAARPVQGAQLVGQDAQLARERNSRVTPAARPDQREITGRLTPGHPLPDQDAQLAHEITGRLTPAARHARENGWPAVIGGPRRDRAAAAKARRMKRKEKKKMRRLVAIGLER